MKRAALNKKKLKFGDRVRVFDPAMTVSLLGFVVKTDKKSTGVKLDIDDIFTPLTFAQNEQIKKIKRKKNTNGKRIYCE